VASAYAQATGVWWGCNWKAEHGPRKLKICGLRSRHARLIAEATCGAESRAWLLASQYLAEVEADAKRAELAASEAMSLVSKGRWEEALNAVDEAVALESKYRISVTWKLLRDEIALKVQQSNLGRSVHEQRGQ
jgi:hypothetical protein